MLWYRRMARYTQSYSLRGPRDPRIGRARIGKRYYSKRYRLCYDEGMKKIEATKGYRSIFTQSDLSRRISASISRAFPTRYPYGIHVARVSAISAERMNADERRASARIMRSALAAAGMAIRMGRMGE